MSVWSCKNPPCSVTPTFPVKVRIKELTELRNSFFGKTTEYQISIRLFLHPSTGERRFHFEADIVFTHGKLFIQLLKNFLEPSNLKWGNCYSILESFACSSLVADRTNVSATLFIRDRRTGREAQFVQNYF